MSNFPNSIDDDFTLPPVNNNITEIGADAINSLRDAVISIEEEIGVSNIPALGAKGSCSSIAERLGVSLNPDGTIKSSILLLSNVFPIYDANIADDAKIKESKLLLFCNTETLYNNYLSTLNIAETASNWIFSIGNRLQNHIYLTDESSGTYNHFLSQIHVSDGSIHPTDERLFNRFTNISLVDPAPIGGFSRNNSNLFTLINDINTDYLIHQKSDGYKLTSNTYNVTTLSGNTYPSNFAHTASGLHLNTSNYTVFPNDIDNLQDFADYIDRNNDALAGKRSYTLFSTGIPRSHRSSVLTLDGYGSPVLPPNAAITYLLQGNASVPQDNSINGDDIIKIIPPTDTEGLKTFNKNFSLIKVGDVLRVNYGFVTGFGYLETEFLVKEKKYIPSIDSSSPVYSIRIDGKNLLATNNASVRVDRALFNLSKGGLLSLSAAQCLDSSNTNSITGVPPSLTISHPRGAVAIGNGFDASQINQTNYKLYLNLYENGDITQPIELRAIDITGNQGATPGKYTLNSIVEATNNSFRRKGFNHRFSAFSYNGNFGIMLSDSYNNAAFSIIAGELRDGYYSIDNGSANHSHPRNIIQYNSSGNVISDPLGFGRNAANIASPYYFETSFTETDAFNHPIKVFLPLRRNNYYIDGAGLESDKLANEPTQTIDQYGDGYWRAQLVSYDSTNGSFRYKINLDLTSSGLAKGKTLVVQSLGKGKIDNFGRFIISNVEFDICDDLTSNHQTFITIFNGMHNTGISNSPSSLPSDSLQPGEECAIYFNSDSVGFNLQHSSDNNSYTSFKRHFEIYLDKQGKTFSLERARMNISGSSVTVDTNGPVKLNADSTLSKINLVRVSPKLRGYTYNLTNLVYIAIKNYEDGEFDASLISYYSPPPMTITQEYRGKVVHGKKGEVVRVFDQTNIDYIDFIINSDEEITSFSSEKRIAVQLFPTLSLDQELMLLASVQLDGITNTISNILDLREFGNVSEKDISDSLLNYLSVPEKLIHSNGIVRGVDLISTDTTDASLTLSGGIVLVNGKFVNVNNKKVNIPAVQELYNDSSFAITLCLCVNDNSEYEFTAIRDYDADLQSVNVNRDLKVYNFLNSQGTGNPYSIKSFYFKDLITSYKELTPVYLIKLKITGAYDDPVYNFSVSDARKFINNESLNDSFTWSDQSSTSISYFKNFNAVKNWINYYGSDFNLVKIKGAIRLDNNYDSYDFSQFKRAVTFEGEGSTAGFNIWNSQFNVGSNITYKNLDITFINDGEFSLLQNQDQSNCIFENVTFGQGSNYSSGDYALSVSINNNNKFKDCNFSTKLASLTMYSQNYFDTCTFTKMSGLTDNNLITIKNQNKFINCNFNQMSLKQTSSNDISVIKAHDEEDSGNYNLFDNCQFESALANNDWDGYFAQGISLNNNNTIKNCNFITNFNFKSGFIKLVNGNNIDNLLIGTNYNSASSWKTIIVNYSDNNYNGIEVGSGNILNNIRCSSIFVINGASSSAIKLSADENILSNCIFNNIFSFKNSLSVTSGNTIINNNFKSLQSKNGINIISNNNKKYNLIIENNYINYIPIIDENQFSPIYLNSGAIYFESLSTDTLLNNVTINNCIFATSTSGLSSYLKNNNSVNITNSPSPYINFYYVHTEDRDNRFVLSNIRIEKCSFIVNSSFADNYRAGIAFTLLNDTEQQSISSNALLLENILIESNSLDGYNGIILAGENDNSFYSARNFIISKNNAKYISAYASPSIARGGIIIDQNTCVGILTLDYNKQNITNTPQETENLTISNNRVQTIEIYSKSS